MKKKTVYALAAALLLLAGCREDGDGANVTVTYEAPAPVTGEPAEYEPPFSEYMLELRGETENYMVVIRGGEHENEISVTVENNRYQSREFIITAPVGYDIYLPADSSDSADVVNLITNDIDSEPIPDIIQFTFSLSEYGAELPGETSGDLQPEPAYDVSRMYTVDGRGELREIQIVTPGDPENGVPETVSDYLDKTLLYHTEPDKFIYDISVDSNVFDDSGNVRPIESRVKIRTMTFDHEDFRLVLGTEAITEDNPLYFGYACWAAANSAAQNFIMNTFNISDFNNYVEMPTADGGTDYYFKIDDSRFTSTEDLMDYLTAIFSKSTAERIFSRSPRKYIDIDGQLYGIVGDSSYDYTLGTLTFSGMEISENKMLFRSRQEKYDEDGRFAGYTDGGDFLISRQEDGSWRVIQYRYPYS